MSHNVTPEFPGHILSNPWNSGDSLENKQECTCLLCCFSSWVEKVYNLIIKHDFSLGLEQFIFIQKLNILIYTALRFNDKFKSFIKIKNINKNKKDQQK